MMRSMPRKTIVSIVAFLYLLTLAEPCAAMGKRTDSSDNIERPRLISDAGDTGYYSYIKNYNDLESAAVGARADTGSLSDSEKNEKAVMEKDGQKGAYSGPDNRWNEWKIKIEQSGLYSLRFDYFALPGKGKDIDFGLQVDGEYVFDELKSLTLSRLWTNKESKDGGIITQDLMGNDRLPAQIEVFKWQSLWIRSPLGMYSEPYRIYLEEGEHLFRVLYKSEPFLLGRINLTNPERPLAYDQYKQKYNSGGGKGKPIYIQAEYASEKTSPMLYPISDRMDASTMDNVPGRNKLNAIGGDNWRFIGQKLTWDFEVEANGWYRLALRARQDSNQGMNSYRNIYIDGEIPFKEAENMCFPYNSKWSVSVLGGDKPVLLYLEKGPHTVSMDVSPGETSGILKEINKSLLDLNTIYRKIIMITGTTPDIIRDYLLEEQIPGLLESMQYIRDRLELQSVELGRIFGSRGTQASIIDEMTELMDGLIKHPYTIPERLDRYRVNVETLGGLLLQLNTQPLMIDYIAFIPDGESIPKARGSLLSRMIFNIRWFLESFIIDYNSVGTNAGGGEPIAVWMSSGRDQAQILGGMINDSFTPGTGIPIKLSIVDTGATLMQATLAGKSPDVALMVPMDTPVNLAMRGALAELGRYDLTGLKEEISPSAWIPFQYQGGVYAIPETQTFDMLFYRKDLFDELGLIPPETWDDFYTVMHELQNYNLGIGIPEINRLNMGASLGISMFERFLYQNGGSYYNEEYNRTNFETETAYEAFERWARLHTEYSLPRDFDFYSRFRTGEMAMSIQPYTMYNMLTQAAPEIAGLWDFCSVPGTLKDSGVIDRTETSVVTGSILLKSALKRDHGKSAFKFISWWTGSKAQSEYAGHLEALMGVGARYAPANRKAFDSVQWTAQEENILSAQWEWVTAVPQIPGSYYIERSLTSALRNVINDNLQPRRQLMLFNRDINSEITRKRKEFGLE